jgi:hypothetical protein
MGILRRNREKKKDVARGRGFIWFRIWTEQALVGVVMNIRVLLGMYCLPEQISISEGPCSMLIAVSKHF